MKTMKMTAAERKQMETLKNALRSSWEAGATAGGRDPQHEVRAWDSGWDAVFQAMKIVSGSR